MRWLTGVEHTDGQAGLVARLVLGPLSLQSVCVRLCPPGEQGEGGREMEKGCLAEVERMS